MAPPNSPTTPTNQAITKKAKKASIAAYVDDERDLQPSLVNSTIPSTMPTYAGLYAPPAKKPAASKPLNHRLPSFSPIVSFPTTSMKTPTAADNIYELIRDFHRYDALYPRHFNNSTTKIFPEYLQAAPDEAKPDEKSQSSNDEAIH